MLPADSSLATEMQAQQRAERAEQQRIKSLVLIYDNESASADQNGESHGTVAQNNIDEAKDAPATALYNEAKPLPHFSRRRGQSRKLQLSDVDW